MAASLVYKNVLLYEAVMLALYGRNYFARYKTVANLIPPRSSVVDVCCGPAILFDRYLRHKNVRYTGLDVSEQFIDRLKRHGGTGAVVDVNQMDPLPKADYVVMHASLCHFLPDPQPIVERMIRAAQVQVIIAEPIRNVTSSKWAFAAALGRRLTDPGDGNSAHRFNERTLDEFFAKFGDRVASTCYVPGGREKVVVLKGSATNQDTAHSGEAEAHSESSLRRNAADRA